MTRQECRVRFRLSQSVVLACLTASGFLLSASPTHAQWTQWGGSKHGFVVDTSGLADTWPAEGPKRIWHRKLGSGYSGIVVDDGVLYTMYRTRKKDVYEYTIALDAGTGKTLWQKRDMAVIPRETADHGKRFTGPIATPLIVGDRLFTLGRNARLHCYQKKDGKILWKKNLKKDFGAQIATCGYSCSPLAYDSTIIVPVGLAEGSSEEGKSLIAFDQASGEVVWRRHTFGIQHSSPIFVSVGGQQQYVLCTDRGVIAVNPADGALLWEHPMPEEEFRGVFTTPVWNGKDTLSFSEREVGYALKLTGGEGATNVELLWSSSKTPMGMGTPVLIGDMLVGAHRGSSMETAFIAVDITTGKRLWQKRGLPMAVAIGDAGKLIILDHDGQFTLATATREDLTIHSQVQLTEQESFTVPTLVGTTLYLRDEKHIMALDLGPVAAAEAKVEG